MSVRVPDRTTSEIQFVYEATQLRDFVVMRMTALPAKWRDTLAIPIISIAYDFAGELIYANDLKQNNLHELQLRVDTLVKAYGKLDSLESAQVLLFKKLRQNPENFERQQVQKDRREQLRLASQVRVEAFLEELGKRISKCRELIDTQHTIDTQFLIELSRASESP